MAEFEWTEVTDLTKDDMIIYPIPNYSKDIESLTPEDCYLYGVILGDGCMNNKDQNGYISLDTHNKKHILDNVVRYFNNKYITHRVESNGNTTRIYWNKTINMPFRYNDVYNYDKQKYVHPRWLNLPIEKSQYIHN